MRPSDQGFEYSFIHKGGGLGQPSEPIENDKRYTDPILFRNNTEVATKGYCTDLYFDEAIKFIASSMTEHRPFFAYIATNAPHGPFGDVPEKLLAHYKTKDIASILPENQRDNAKMVDRVERIAAMITNIDQNVGKLVNMLEANELLENTIIIFLNDNGPNTQRQTGKFRGMKTNVHEGGVRSPLWIHWPAKFKTGKKITSNIAAHIDIMPTIMDACQLGVPEAFAFDGRSLLEKSLDENAELAPRPVVIQAHRGAKLIRYHNFMIRDQQWKLSNNSGFGNTRLEERKAFELYNLVDDPGETNNLAEKHPEEVKRLTELYDAWYDDVTMTRIRDKGIPFIIVDKAHENPLVLTWQERISQNWGMNYDGFWKLFFSAQTRADIIVYAAPGYLMKDVKLEGFTPVLQIGTTVYKGKPLGKDTLCVFPGINIPKGKHNVQAMFLSEDETEEFHAYQIRLIHR
jgi:arylsulfatase/arylsulfatase A